VKDWLGNDLAVGDRVLYPAGSGRSITMVIGEITGFGEFTEPQWRSEDKVLTTIKVQPLKASRWKQHHGTDFYVDTRTGKRIDPYRQAKDGSFPHIAVPGYYLDADGARHEHQQYGRDACGAMREQCTYVSTVFRKHVEKRHEGPKPVTIHITENVTRWHGAL
jgi:hypothetical protein